MGYRPIQGKQMAQYNSHCICGAVYLVLMWCGPPNVAVWCWEGNGVGQKRQNNGREMWCAVGPPQNLSLLDKSAGRAGLRIVCV